MLTAVCSITVLILGVSALVPKTARAAEVDCAKPIPTPLTYLGLKSYIEACRIDQVESFLRHLPSKFRSQYSLVYRSHSKVEVENPGTVDPLHPRTILFSQPYPYRSRKLPEEKVVLAFASNPNRPSFQDLELFEYQPGPGKFKFSVVHFQRGKSAHYEDSPTSCLKCHGSEPKPIWDDYHQWNGVYGADDDNFTSDTGDDEGNYLAFVKNFGRPGYERFSALVYKNGPAHQYQFGPTHMPEMPEYARNNTRLTGYLGLLQATALATRIRNAPGYSGLRATIEWIENKCTVELSSKFSPREMGQIFTHYVQSVNSEHPELRSPLNLNAFRAIQEVGANRDNPMPGLLGKMYAKLIPYRLTDISLQLHPLEAHGSTEEYSRKDTEYALDFLEKYGWIEYATGDGELGEIVPELLSLDKPEGICETLYGRMKRSKIRVTRGLPTVMSAHETLQVGKSAEVVPVKLTRANIPQVSTGSGVPNPFGKCINCHRERKTTKDIAEGNEHAPIIPFGDLSDLSRQLRSDALLVNQIRTAVRTNYMPLDNENFSKEEKSAILKFIEQL